jgi:hypothetical protein
VGAHSAAAARTRRVCRHPPGGSTWNTAAHGLGLSRVRTAGTHFSPPALARNGSDVPEVPSRAGARGAVPRGTSAVAPAWLLLSPGAGSSDVHRASGESVRVRIVRSRRALAAGSCLVRMPRTYRQAIPGRQPVAGALRLEDRISIPWNIPPARAALSEIAAAPGRALCDVPRGTGSRTCVEANESAAPFSGCTEGGRPHLSFRPGATSQCSGPRPYRPAPAAWVDRALGAERIDVPRGTLAGAAASSPDGSPCEGTLGSARTTPALRAESRGTSSRIGPLRFLPASYRGGAPQSLPGCSTWNRCGK